MLSQPKNQLDRSDGSNDDRSPAENGRAHAQRAAKLRARKCIITGLSSSESPLLRFACAPDGLVVPDFSAKLPGRGAWVQARRAALEEAIKRGAFARAFKQQVNVPEGLVDQTADGLVHRALGTLGLAQRAGDVVAGFEKVAARVKDGRFYVLLSARDSAGDGRKKMTTAFAAASAQKSAAHGAGVLKNMAHVTCFDAAELSSALGRDQVVHAVVTQIKPAQRFIAQALLVQGFREANA